MRLAHVRFTVRRMMIVVAVLAASFMVLRAWWDYRREQDLIRARILIRQKLLRAIGPANEAVGPPGNARAEPLRREPAQLHDELRAKPKILEGSGSGQNPPLQPRR
jgi:hypothetical protein